MSKEKKVGNQRTLPISRVQVVFTLNAPEVEVIEEDAEKALTPTVAREKSLAPKVTPRGGSVGDESGA